MHPRQLALAVLFAALASGAAAQPDAAIRLKSRSFVPPADLQSEAGRAEHRARAQARRAADPNGRVYLIVQFAHPVSDRDLAELRRAGATPLRYVPDHAMAISAPAGFDPTRVRGARWAGELEPGDRLSQAAVRELRGHGRHPLMYVDFHPDVSAAEAAARVRTAGAVPISRRGLPPHLVLVPADPRLIEALASDEYVAWIYPAPSDEVSSTAPICQGVATPVGMTASYATVGDGWDGPGRGSADLGYHVQAYTPQLSASVAHQEITRALQEWSRYVEVNWRQVTSPQETRSITILWGTGEHGDGYPFGADVLAHAFYQAPVTPEPIAGDVHFNDAFSWGANSASRYDVFSVMLHEAGHSLGLAHSGDPNDVMYPAYRGIVSGLSAGDVATARQLYASTAPLPAGWTAQAIGGNVTTYASEAGGVFTLEANGRDVWGTADEFGFVSQPFDGDGDVIARVDSLAAVDRWTKAGVMIRAGTSAGAAHAFMLVSGERGVAFQRRRVANGTSLHTDGGPGTAPRWVRLSRRGDRFEAYVATDGAGWRLVGADTIVMPRQVLAGLALSGHHESALATARFSNLQLIPLAPGWTSADIGAVGIAGSMTLAENQVRIAGAGADIWHTADGFHFAWRELQGDGEITARVASLQNTHHWAKAGVMMRASLDPGAAHAFMLVSAGRGYAFQRRRAAGDISHNTSGGAGTAPQWVRLTRQGTTLRAFRSVDGVNWVQVGTDTVSLGQTVLVGLAVTSHTTSATSLAVFEDVTIR